MQVAAKDKSEAFQRVSVMDSFPGQSSDEANWQGTDSGEEICCIQTVSCSNTGMQNVSFAFYTCVK